MTPAAKRRLKQLAIACAVASGAWGVERLRAIASQEAAARDAAARQVRLESIGYYRVRASYIVKNTGEHIDFDYVAACAVVQTNYLDGDRSVDTPFGIAPKSFIAPTRDGHAIQVVTPEACNHEVEDGFIPPDLIPLTIFHDDVDNLAFGWGYTSQDAYDNTRAQISFEGASVTAATYADRLAWEAKAVADYKPFGRILSPLGFSKHYYGIGRTVSSHCDFYVRVPVFAEGKPTLTAEWEKRGKPEFWIHENGTKPPEFWDGFKGQSIMYIRPSPRTKGGGVGTIQSYTTQRWDKIHHHRDTVYSPNEVYPYLPISLSSVPPPTLASTVFPTKVPVSDDWKGLAACGMNDPGIDDVFFYNNHFSPSGHLNYYDRDSYKIEPMGNRTRPFMANDTVVTKIENRNTQVPRIVGAPRIFFQRDEFVLTDGSNSVEGIL